MNKKKVILSLSGHDPSGGAGLQIDILTSQFFDFHCVSSLTCQTVQTTKKLHKVIPTELEFFKQNLSQILKDSDISGVKVGALACKKIALEIMNVISSMNVPIVIDPIILSGSGERFIEKEDLIFYRDNFYPHSSLLTPNIAELKMLTKKESEKESIKFLLSKGIENIYVTGKVENNKIMNSLYSKGVLLQKTESDYLDKAIHGTGCALSTAILCNLVNQKDLKDSCLISHKLLSNLVHKSFETNGQDILSFK